ncbi:MAG: hypothetical protein DMG40_25410 [Acidobacteria bacterium]|nr:MAG: hypothetical protein DMG40_25410 [Acidobacteriota bacterium]
MIEKNSAPSKRLPLERLSRRNLLLRAAGATAGAGLLLRERLGQPVFAQEQEDDVGSCRHLPRPIPHITTPPGGHFFFPAPVTEPADPSTITDFKGMIAQAEIFFTGQGTKLATGETATYGFHTDWRFMTGMFVGVDGIARNGTLSFI